MMGQSGLSEFINDKTTQNNNADSNDSTTTDNSSSSRTSNSDVENDGKGYKTIENEDGTVTYERTDKDYDEEEHSIETGGVVAGPGGTLAAESEYVVLSKDYKCCPSCMEPCPKTASMTWECNNDCGTIKFTTGYFERETDGLFLNSVDVASFILNRE